MSPEHVLRENAVPEYPPLPAPPSDQIHGENVIDRVESVLAKLRHPQATQGPGYEVFPLKQKGTVALFLSAPEEAFVLPKVALFNYLRNLSNAPLASLEEGTLPVLEPASLSQLVTWLKADHCDVAPTLIRVAYAARALAGRLSIRLRDDEVSLVDLLKPHVTVTINPPPGAGESGKLTLHITTSGVCKNSESFDLKKMNIDFLRDLLKGRSTLEDSVEVADRYANHPRLGPLLKEAFAAHLRAIPAGDVFTCSYNASLKRLWEGRCHTERTCIPHIPLPSDNIATEAIRTFPNHVVFNQGFFLFKSRAPILYRVVERQDGSLAVLVDVQSNTGRQVDHITIPIGTPLGAYVYGYLRGPNDPTVKSGLLPASIERLEVSAESK